MIYTTISGWNISPVNCIKRCVIFLFRTNEKCLNFTFEIDKKSFIEETPWLDLLDRNKIEIIALEYFYMRECVIYVVTNNVNQKKYVGKSVNYKVRFANHLKFAQQGKKSRFYEAIRKHGAENFKIDVLEVCDEQLLSEKEKFWISKLETQNPDFGYNMTPGGDGLCGDLVRQSNSRRICSTKTRMKLSNQHRHKKHQNSSQTYHLRSEQGEENRIIGVKKGYEKRKIRKNNPNFGKQQILFIVGPDRCGKSHIAKALGEKLNIKVFKASSEHKTFLGDQKAFINDIRYADPRICDLLFQTNLSVIFDRGFPCERIYAEFYNRETDLNAIKYLDKEYAKLNAKIIICTRKSFLGIKDDLDERLNEKALHEISDLYLKFSKWTSCKNLILNVDDENLDREVSEVISWLGVFSTN